MSNESKYTPGPWVGTGRSVYAESNMDQPFVMIYQRDKSVEECYANVQLIAAAPETLEALELLFENIKRWNAFGSVHADKLIKQVGPLIKKAKGEK